MSNEINDLMSECEELKNVIEEQNKILLDYTTKNNILEQSTKHFQRELFYLEHEVRVLKAELCKFKENKT